MRRLIAAALLWASPACAQEAEPPAEKPPLTAEEKAEIARLLDDEEKRAGRGASNWDSNIWGSMVAARNMATEPPPPPLQDHPCDAFAENELVEVKVANDVNPQPVGLLIPASYLPIHRVQSYRITDIEAVFLMNAWHHDFAPYDLRRQFFSLGKKPNDELSFLVRGGRGRIAQRAGCHRAQVRGGGYL